jgi:CheY-like chemotaxis protein
MMPGMDGMETVRKIRNEIPGDYSRNVPIIALTANALAGNEEMFLANGFNAFISKPIDIIRLDRVLNIWVRDRQDAETVRRAEKAADIGNNPLDTQHGVTGILEGMAVGGLDITGGLKRYSSEAAYLDILRSWHLHTPALLKQLAGLSAENLHEYAIAVHGLKGSSYGICANNVGRKAEELEQYAKAGDFSFVKEKNEAFISMAESLLAEVGKLLDKAGENKAQKQKVPAPDPSLLARLLDEARRYKTVLMEEIMGELESFEYGTGGELVAWLRGQMDNLEYDEICSRLESPDPLNWEQNGNQRAGTA